MGGKRINNNLNHNPMKHKFMKNTNPILSAVLIAVMASCSSNPDFNFEEPPMGGEQPGMGGGGMPGSDDGNVPDFSTTITPYQGQLATDADKDIIGENEDLFWELNTFKNEVTITYSGNTATVETNNEDILVPTGNDSHVVIDMLTNSVSGVKINVSGESDNGSLKIYGEKKLLLNLNGVSLTSQIGPAINSQCKKRMFVNLKEGTVNTLTDVATYSDDPYYLNNVQPDDEDRKGCLFSEGNLIFSGYGSLVVAGKQKHGIASDGYMYLRPGTTIAVTEAAKNAIHIKGDKDENIGIIIAGGLVYTLTESEAGKGLKTDYHVEIQGGQLDLNTTGEAIYEEEENDTSSAAGIKTDGDIIISGGEISVKSIGTGGKGLNADGDLNMTGGVATIVTTGGKYVYNSALDLDSSPKGIKVDGDITIDDGQLNIMVTGVSDGSEGLESKSELTVNGGEIFIYSYDDAINASIGININGGKIYAYAVNNDAIDSNGYLYVNGGLIIASAASGSEESLDCEISSKFLINGGIIIGFGGTSMTSPSSSSKQRVVIYGGLSLAKDNKMAVLDSSDKSIMTFTVPRSYNGGTLFLSSSGITANSTYTLCGGGSISGYTDSWNGWFDGGTWSGGTSVGTFTSSNVITSVGTGGMRPGGGGGFSGGW